MSGGIIDANTNSWASQSAITAPAPIASSLAQASGPWRATPNGVDGSNFVSGATVKINGVSCTSVVFNSSTSISFDSPVFTSNGGPYDVIVTNPDAQTGTLAASYTVAGDYLDIPSAKVLFALDPAVGVNLVAKTITDAVHGHVFSAASAMSVDSSGLNGEKRLVFPNGNAGANGLTCTGLTSSSTKAQAFAIGNVSVQGLNCLWGNIGSSTPFFAFSTTNEVYEAFGSTIRKDAIGNIVPPANFAYEVVADGSGNWQAILNGLTIDTVTGNTIAWPATSVEVGFNSTNPTNFYLDGGLDFVMWLVDNLSTAEETMMQAYITRRWGVVFNRSANIRGYGHSIAAGGNASSVGTTDMYPRTIQGLQSAQPGRWSLSYVGHPSEHVAQWMGHIAGEITPFYEPGVANAKSPINIFALIEVINSVTFYVSTMGQSGSVAGANALADHLAFLAAVKSAQPGWFCLAYCMYAPYGFTADMLTALAIVNAGLVAAVGGGVVDAVVRLDLDADFVPPGPPPTTYIDDGTHPTDAGHQEIANDGIPFYEALYAAHAS